MGQTLITAISAALLATWVNSHAIAEQKNWMAAGNTAAPPDAGAAGNGSAASPRFICRANQFRLPLNPGC